MSTPFPRLRGIVPPMITPLAAPDELDRPGLERQVAHLLSGGVHGLFILGTTGEGPSLSHRLRRELVTYTCRLVSGRVPVLVGITDTALTESLRLARAAAEAGAAAVVAAPPHYFPVNQTELGDHLTALAGQLPLPLYLYNMPQMTKTVIAVETLRRMLDQPNVAGLKDSSGDLAYYAGALAVARQRPDWSVLIGPEALLQQSLALGGDGGVAGGANLCPRLFVDLFDACLAGDTSRAADLQAQVEALDQLYRVSPCTSSIMNGLKCALSLRGICHDAMALPFGRYAATERDRVRTLLATTLRSLPLPPLAAG